MFIMSEVRGNTTVLFFPSKMLILSTSFLSLGPFIFQCYHYFSFKFHLLLFLSLLLSPFPHLYIVLLPTLSTEERNAFTFSVQNNVHCFSLFLVDFEGKCRWYVLIIIIVHSKLIHVQGILLRVLKPEGQLEQIRSYFFLSCPHAILKGKMWLIPSPLKRNNWCICKEGTDRSLAFSLSLAYFLLIRLLALARKLNESELLGWVRDVV